MQRNWYPLNRPKDGFMNSNSGVLINLNEPEVDMFEIDDIAQGLSNTCRWGGQISPFFSVAQHSVLVARLAYALTDDPEYGYAGLMHDASEAYINDVPKPVKNLLGSVYAELEEKLMSKIGVKHLVRAYALAHIKPFDEKLGVIEHQDFREGNPLPMTKLIHDVELEKYDRYWTPQTAKRIFIQEYNRFWMLVKERRFV